MSYPIAVLESEEHTVLESHRTIEAAHAGADIGAALRDLHDTAARMGLTPTGPPSITYPSPSVAADDLRVTLTLPVDPTAADEFGEATAVRATQAATYVRTIHHGDYQHIGAAYRALEDWMRGVGLRSAGPVTEIYLVGPDTALRPQDLATEIRIPVAHGPRPSVRIDLPVPETASIVRPSLVQHGFHVLSQVDLDTVVHTEDSPRPHVLLTACLPWLARCALAIDPARDRLLFTEFVIRRAGNATVVEVPTAPGLPGDGPELTALIHELSSRVADVLADLAARAGASPAC
ncbi:GyrI-like domain-containing protein [Nocardia takedensis]|uniref:GyrI-like domain-containing protein n=1 Tax=Nocardia takedensis TaxID=259390 RepID=UPI0012F6B405|nr:GyrI-like domain-containing protein [Nocardia takedensis]